MTFAELRPLYDKGQTETVLSEIGKVDLTTGQHPEHDDLLTLKGWCFYRQKKFREAYDIATSVGGHQWARELEASIHAYASDFKNDDKLREIATEIGDSVPIANALVIRARADDCHLLTHADVDAAVQRHASNNGVNVANLHHNAGRFYLAKPRNDTDLQQALTYLDQALERYGTDANFHHRAAANFWKSQAVEKLQGKPAAAEVMEESVRLWKRQLELDPKNPSFQTSSTAAEKRLDELRQ